MRKPESIGQWLKPDADASQLEWVAKYIMRRTPTINLALPPARDYLVQVLNCVLGSDPKSEALRKMKSAWNSHVYDTRHGSKTKAYSLSLKSIRHLGDLAKWNNRPISRTLEDLIERGFNFEADERAKRSLELKAIKIEMAQTYQKKQSKPSENQSTRIKVKHLEHHVAVLEKMASKLLFENCKYQVLIADMGFEGQTPTAEQEAMVMERFKSRAEYHRQESELNLSLAKMSIASGGPSGLPT